MALKLCRPMRPNPLIATRAIPYYFPPEYARTGCCSIPVFSRAVVPHRVGFIIPCPAETAIGLTTLFNECVGVALCDGLIPREDVDVTEEPIGSAPHFWVAITQPVRLPVLQSGLEHLTL